MKKQLISLLPYIIILSLDFYLLPFFSKNTGTAMLFMLCLMPLIALTTAILYGIRNGFSLILPFATFFLFFPTIYLYYNASAWIYAVIYTIIVLVGTVIGKLLYGKR